MPKAGRIGRHEQGKHSNIPMKTTKSQVIFRNAEKNTSTSTLARFKKYTIYLIALMPGKKTIPPLVGFIFASLSFYINVQECLHGATIPGKDWHLFLRSEAPL
jgi:hypothetical protein